MISLHRISPMLVTAAVLAALVVLACATTGHRPTTSEGLQLTHYPAPLATPGCVEQNTPERVSGTGPGGTADGPDAILAFHYAFYSLRSGTAAREVVIADAEVPSAADIQAGIDSLPVATRYCVQVIPGPAATDDAQHWHVELAQQIPGEPEVTHRQIATTRVETGHTLIAAIAAV